MKFTPREYVAAWLKRHNVTIDERGSLASPDKREYNDLLDTMWLDYIGYLGEFNKNTDEKAKGTDEKNIRKALDELLSIEMVARREALFSSIKFDGAESTKLLELFVKALTGATEQKVIGVMAHLLWQIKRKLNDQDISYHIMPILLGKQGAGKSVALQRLFKPLANLSLELTLTEVTDARFYFAFNHNFIAILDEMAGAKKADIEILKKQITATHNDVRKLNTNRVTKIKQNASFIGTTNRAVSEIIFDTSGMRRFYEIRVLDRIDWAAINAIDYVELYRGINETRPEGYLPDVMAEVVLDQEKLVGTDDLQAFLDHHHINCEKDPKKEFLSSDLYDIYKVWAENNGMKVMNSVWFGRKLGNRGCVSHIRRTGKLTTRYYLINEDSEIHKTKFGDILSTSNKTWDN